MGNKIITFTDIGCVHTCKCRDGQYDRLYISKGGASKATFRLGARHPLKADYAQGCPQGDCYY